MRYPKCATIKELEERMAEARKKHPEWGHGPGHAISVLKLELAELEHARTYEGEARLRDEALDVAAVAMRIYEGDWK
jgi:hypothetical protein